MMGHNIIMFQGVILEIIPKLFLLPLFIGNTAGSIANVSFSSFLLLGQGKMMTMCSR